MTLSSHILDVLTDDRMNEAAVRSACIDPNVNTFCQYPDTLAAPHVEALPTAGARAPAAAVAGERLRTRILVRLVPNLVLIVILWIELNLL